MSVLASNPATAYSVVGFTHEDAAALNIQPNQARWCDDWLEAIRQGRAWTLLRHGRPVACAGVIHVWPGRGVCWALIDADISHRGMLVLTRQARAYFDTQCAFRRIEATADAKWDAARRWLRLLGFTCEGRMRRYGPEGEDHLLFARVK